VLALMIAGEAIAARLNLPLPGAALGLLTLSTVFMLRGTPDRGSEKLFDFAAPYFPLFFVPAAVGVIGKLDVLASGWLPVVVAVIPGTALTLLLTGHVFQALTRQCAEGADA
jgi:holin-like protein